MKSNLPSQISSVYLRGKLKNASQKTIHSFTNLKTFKLAEPKTHYANGAITTQSQKFFTHDLGIGRF
jgi:hypothetical protein